MIVHDVIQGSEAWHELRLGKFTGSTAASAFLTKGKNADEIGEGLINLIYQKVAETVLGESQDAFQGNAHTERGTALEPYAVAAYEDENYIDVVRVGFVEASKYIGCSPDGLIGNDGMIEVKCPSAPEYVRYVDELVDGELTQASIPTKYVAQMQWQMWVSDRKWCDFVVYNPDFAPLQMLVCRVFANHDTWTTFEKKAAWVATKMDNLLSAIAKGRNDA